jgi:hypothetical protein
VRKRVSRGLKALRLRIRRRAHERLVHPLRAGARRRRHSRAGCSWAPARSPALGTVPGEAAHRRCGRRTDRRRDRGRRASGSPPRRAGDHPRHAQRRCPHRCKDAGMGPAAPSSSCCRAATRS